MQIYQYFGSKDRLLDAVWESMVRQVVEGTPVDFADLPGYVVRLAGAYAEHADILRLVTWQRRKSGNDPPDAQGR